MTVRLPARVCFPFGYRVRVLQVTDAQMQERLDEEDDLVDGLWDAEARTIYIRKALPRRRRRYILGHELGHAFLDWQHFCLDAGAMRN